MSAYTDYYRHRYYDDDYYRPYRRWLPYYNYYWGNQISNVNQNINNFGYMQDVYQNAIINQLRAQRRRER